MYILTWIRYWNFFVFFYSCNLKTYFATLDFLMVCFYSFLFFFPFFLFSVVFWIVLYLSREKKRGNIVLRLPRSGSNTSLELFLRRGENWGTRRKTLGTSAFVLANTKADVASHVHCSIICVLLYRHECFTGKYTTRKIHKNYIRDPSGLFSIILHVSLSMT